MPADPEHADGQFQYLISHVGINTGAYEYASQPQQYAAGQYTARASLDTGDPTQGLATATSPMTIAPADTLALTATPGAQVSEGLPLAANVDGVSYDGGAQILMSRAPPGSACGSSAATPLDSWNPSFDGDSGVLNRVLAEPVAAPLSVAAPANYQGNLRHGGIMGFSIAGSRAIGMQIHQWVHCTRRGRKPFNGLTELGLPDFTLGAGSTIAFHRTYRTVHLRITGRITAKRARGTFNITTSAPRRPLPHRRAAVPASARQAVPMSCAQDSWTLSMRSSISARPALGR